MQSIRFPSDIAIIQSKMAWKFSGKMNKFQCACALCIGNGKSSIRMIFVLTLNLNALEIQHKNIMSHLVA